MRSAKVVEKRVEMILEKEKADKPVIEKKRNVSLNCQQNSRSKFAIEINSLSKSYASNLFSNLSLIVKTGQKVAIVGKNRTGKTTLLNIIMGMEKASNGSISIPPSVSIAYYAQDYENLNFENSILDEVIENDSTNQTMTRTILSCLGLKNNKVLQKIESLSIGERNKVFLVKTIISGANLLILDEPTNHLEIDAREIIEDALKDFKGTVLFVSHDRRFIDKIANFVFDLESNINFDNFSNYLESIN